MVYLGCAGVEGSGDKWSAFPGDEVFLEDAGHAMLVESQYELSPPSSAPLLREPRKTYRGPRNRRSADASGSAYQQDIFTRLDRLRENAGEGGIKEQLERLQAIAALMQQRNQGPMPGEMLRVYGWEVEDIANKLVQLMKHG